MTSHPEVTSGLQGATVTITGGTGSSATPMAMIGMTLVTVMPRFHAAGLTNATDPAA